MDYELSEHAYLSFSAFLQDKLGIVLGQNRQYLVRSRLSVIARDNKYTDLNVFLQDVVAMKSRALSENCLELMTTNETFWFRDEYPFALLSEHILPALHKSKQSLRIWSSACASGQEAYSIAMCIKEFQEKHPGAFSKGVEILGTDYSAKMVKHAQAGLYDQLALGRGLPLNLKRKYFVEHDHKHMQVESKLRAITTFKCFNLLGEYSCMGKFDVVFCRNVLIYFNGKEKTNILKKFAACLAQDGTLFLGAAESISGAETLFKMKNMPKGLYYSKL